MSVAIRSERLSKRYRISAARHNTLRDLLADGARNLLRRPGAADGDGLIWAVRDASFEVRRGETVGIIGRNGAGKSTLLKILSRITEPTAGCARIYGRVGSLLEVGTGFHPELTGRENIYLNGAILGMRRREIARKFDEIVAFAAIERFIDTPVKRYSSGMHVRLAFAVAAHLEPDILLVDEVLAVGDAAFQQKCLGKMSSVAREGRTVLFVSHNMAALQNLCRRGLVLQQGRVVFDGPAADAVAAYLQALARPDVDPFDANPLREGDGTFRLTGARVLDGQGREARFLIAGQPAAFEFTYDNRRRVHLARLHLTLFNHLGTAVTSLDMDLTGFVPHGLGPAGRFTCHVPNLPLPVGEYRGGVEIYVGGRLADLVPNAVLFRVESSTFFPTGRTTGAQHGACLVAHTWEHEPAGVPH